MISKDAKAKESPRKQTRYAVSEDCRLRASIRVQSSDESSANKDWPGTLVDLSAGGAHIQISMAAVAYLGDSCVLTLTQGGAKTQVRGSLAHYICSARHSVCGVKFDFHTPGADAAYLPYFKAIAASATLKGGPTVSDTPGRFQEEYRGPAYAKLVVWRNDKAGGPLAGFDYTIARYAASLATVDADMARNKAQLCFRAAPAAGGSLSQSQEMEARSEFSLAASNLPQTIAPDIRRLLRLVS